MRAGFAGGEQRMQDCSRASRGVSRGGGCAPEQHLPGPGNGWFDPRLPRGVLRRYPVPVLLAAFSICLLNGPVHTKGMRGQLAGHDGERQETIATRALITQAPVVPCSSDEPSHAAADASPHPETREPVAPLSYPPIELSNGDVGWGSYETSGVGKAGSDLAVSRVQLTAYEDDPAAAADIVVLPPAEPPRPSDRSESDVRKLANSASTSELRLEAGRLDRGVDSLAQLPSFSGGMFWPKLGKSTDGPEAGQPSSMTLHLDDVDIRKALEMLSREGSLSILVAPNVSGKVTANLQGLSFEEALSAILKLCNLVAQREDNLIFVYSPAEVPRSGRSLRTFPLDYVSAADVLQAVQGLLSPTGQSFVTSSSPTDNRKTQEVLVVEDLAAYLERIEQYLAQIDQPPRQVLIEVHVLEVELTDDKKHGVNFENAIKMLGNTVTVQTLGFATPIGPQSQGFYVNVDGANLEALVECLKTTTDAKTLASPRILVLNGQEASIQIGERLGYRVTRVTETAAVEDIEFLNVGVVLSVTPRISRGNQVVMHVKPKVSSGAVTNDLPEEETTEVETDVLLADGQGIVIGGLIQEKDSNVQSKIPWLGDLWLVGRLFQSQHLEKTRSETIITLMPRVLPYQPEYQIQDEMDVARTEAPLLEGPLCRSPRPWEPSLPDAITNPRVIRLPCTHGTACRCRTCQQPDDSARR